MKPTTMWAVIAPWDKKIPNWLVHRTRKECIDSIIEGYPPEWPESKWAHWYRQGWRVIKVTVTPTPDTR